MASNSIVTMGVGTQEAAARATDSQEVVATAVVSAATGTAAKDLAMDSVRWEVVEAAEGAVVEAAGGKAGGEGAMEKRLEVEEAKPGNLCTTCTCTLGTCPQGYQNTTISRSQS